MSNKPNLTSEQEELARRLAQGLGESEYLPVYRKHVLSHPPERLARAYEEAMAVPPNEIKKTRGALFNYLLKKHAKEETNPGD